MKSRTYIWSFTSIFILGFLAVWAVGCGSGSPGGKGDSSAKNKGSGSEVTWVASENSDEGGGADESLAADEGVVDSGGEEVEPDDGGAAEEPAVAEEPVVGEEPVVDESPPPVPTKIETKLDKNTAKAGETVGVTCTVFDQYGNQMSGEATELKVTPSPKGNVTDKDVTIEKVGKYEVACKLQSGSLEDTTPEQLTIVPGDPAAVDTSLNPAQIRAGSSSTVTCTVYDQFGNTISGIGGSFSVTPNTSIKISGSKVSGTKVGTYSVACKAGGISDPTPATLEIIPGYPARIVLTVDPKKQYYKPGESIMLVRKVYDQYGNEIKNAPVKVTLSPDKNADKTGLPDSIIFNRDGVYRVRVSVTGQTAGGKKVEAEVTIKVDGIGPVITFTYPKRADMLAGSSRITVRGKVSDSVSGVASLKINGRSVSVGKSGDFSFVMNAGWGLNLLEAEAKDRAGNVGYRAQSFLWSSRYVSIGGFIGRGVMARLNQKAIDDGDRRTLNDLASILERVINNIDIDSMVPPTLVSGRKKVGFIKISYSVTKNGKVTMGRRELKLFARPGGLRVWVKVYNVRIPLRARASRLRKSFTITASDVTIDADINISYFNGRPLVTVPRVNADVSKVKVNLFGGIFKFLNGLVTNAARKYIKKALEDAIRKELPGPIAKFLQGFKFNKSFKLPQALGGKTITINSSLDVVSFDGKGGTLGLKIALSAPKGIPSGKRGTPLRGQYLPPWGSSYAFGIGISYNTANQAFTAAWFSGAFKRDITSTIGGKGAGSFKVKKMIIDAQLPPIMHPPTGGFHTVVGLGDLKLDTELQMPGSTIKAVAYLTASFGANISITPKNEIVLKLSTTPRIFAVDIVSLSGTGSNANPGALSKALKGLSPMISQFLSSSTLQKFPIPAIDLGAFGGKYGIPPNTKLVLHGAKLQALKDYLLLTGNLIQK